MPTTTERAVKGHEGSKLKLFESNKSYIYAFCDILLEDGKKAATAVESVMNEVWRRLPSSGISTDTEFRHLLTCVAAEHCRLLLFGKNSNSFKVSKTSRIRLPELKEEAYSDVLSDGLSALRAMLNASAPEQRFVFLLHTAGDLSFNEIAKAINQREAVAEYLYRLALSNLIRSSNEAVSVPPEQIKALLARALESEALPSAAYGACVKQIKSHGKKALLRKRVLIPIICGLLCVIGITAAAVIKNKDVAATDDSGTSGSEETEAGYTPTALDTELTYYADIEIENYGTVTVKLDQASAPISAANFVELAQSGFYDGLTFHRIIEDFMIQGGDPNGDGTGGSENTIVGEFTDNGYENNLSHTRGAISMARSSDYNSASSQFFIVHKDSTSLDGQYAVFGYVTEGMEIVDKICESAEPTDDNGTIPSAAQPVITSVTIRTE